MRLDSSPERQGTPTPGLVSTSKEIAEYRLDEREIENPTVRMTGDETAGFDPVTFFASQTLQGGGGFDSKRSVYFKPSVPTNTNFTYTTTGPFTHEVITQEEVELTSDSGGEGEGLLKLPLGDAEGRQVKVQVLPPKGRTIELRKVIYVDDSDPQNITTYEGTEPPAAADLEVSLNDIFKKQAGVQITVVRGVDIIVLSSQLPLQYSAATPTNPRKPIFLTTPAVQQHLWGPYNPDFPPLDPELVLYFVPGLASNTSGLAFGIPSRAALIGPSSGRYSVAKICAHEMGHCFGLSHVWLNQDAGNVSLPQLPDKGGTRLLSYGDGLILRYREAKIVNEWQPGTTTQPGN